MWITINIFYADVPQWILAPVLSFLPLYYSRNQAQRWLSVQLLHWRGILDIQKRHLTKKIRLPEYGLSTWLKTRPKERDFRFSLHERWFNSCNWILFLQVWSNWDRGQGRILLVVWTINTARYYWCCFENPNQSHIWSIICKVKGRLLSILAFTVSSLWMLASKLHSERCYKCHEPKIGKS